MIIDFGIFGEPIEEQLSENGYRFKDEKDIEKYNKLIKSLNMIRVHSIITEKEAEKALERLAKKLKTDIEKI